MNELGRHHIEYQLNNISNEEVWDGSSYNAKNINNKTYIKHKAQTLNIKGNQQMMRYTMIFNKFHQ